LRSCTVAVYLFVIRAIHTRDGAPNQRIVVHHVFLDSDTLVGVESLIGSSYSDTLTGSGANDTLNSDSGAVTIYGLGRADILDGGNHNDTVRGDSGNDSLKGYFGADNLFGDGGDDSVNSQEDIKAPTTCKIEDFTSMATARYLTLPEGQL
jgi:hypothetical protein